MAAILASSASLQRVGAFSPAQRPSRRALVVRATAVTEEKVEAKAEAAPVEQQTAAPAPTAQKASQPAVRRPHSTSTTYGERLATDPLGECWRRPPLPPPPAAAGGTTNG